MVPPASSLSPEDDQFLNDVESASFLFFWEQGSPNTGMVKDRCNVHDPSQSAAASIAATGFGLTALCIGEQRGFIPSTKRWSASLQLCVFCGRSCPTIADSSITSPIINTGERMWDSEVSSVDTAILLCGCSPAGNTSGMPRSPNWLTLIFNRVDWTWLSEDTRCCRMAGRRKSAFFLLAGITTAS